MTQQAYIRAVRDLYIQLPQTSKRFSRWDRQFACELYRRQVPFDQVRAAMMLAVVNRLYREGPPLPTIRSLHYFRPEIDQALRQPLPRGYVEYLEYKIADYPRALAKRASQTHRRLPSA